MTEADLRDSLHTSSRDERLKDPDCKVYLPPVGGLTVYIFGDPRKIRDPLTEIAVRVHDVSRFFFLVTEKNNFVYFRHVMVVTCKTFSFVICFHAKLLVSLLY